MEEPSRIEKSASHNREATPLYRTEGYLTDVDDRLFTRRFDKHTCPLYPPVIGSNPDTPLDLTCTSYDLGDTCFTQTTSFEHKLEDRNFDIIYFSRHSIAVSNLSSERDSEKRYSASCSAYRSTRTYISSHAVSTPLCGIQLPAVNVPPEIVVKQWVTVSIPQVAYKKKRRTVKRTQEWL